MSGKYRFSIDRGGTFTDVFAKTPSGSTRVCKLLSRHELYDDAPTEGIRRIIEMETGTSMARTTPIDSSMIESIRMGTTVATNALLERNGEPTALLITQGFKDALHIGNQARPNIFDLSIAVQSPVYTEVLEVEERVAISRPDCALDLQDLKFVSTSSTDVVVLTPLNTTKLRKDLHELKTTRGINSLAIVLLHSWAYTEHEEQVKQVALSMGFKHVSCSHEVMRMIRFVPRGFTTAVDSYTTPLIRDYLQTFTRGFTDLNPNQVLFMQSDGGLTTMNRFCGSRAVLSGPAGGVVGYARTVFDKYKKPVIGFDMGGTSTDVSRFDGEFLHTFESVTAGVPLQCAQLDIQTVAAGGGSKLSFTSGIYNVGPESAGASPGPVAYDQGGQSLTITDANLMCNRLVPSRFPKIFGPTHDSPLNSEKTRATFTHLSKKINEFNRANQLSEKTLEEIALGFISVANETMARPIRNITQGKGFDPSTHMLACFGGAGGQHACAIAASLGIGSVSVPRNAGILSAVGIFLADVVVEASEPVGKKLGCGVEHFIVERFCALEGELRLRLEGTYDRVVVERFLNLRYTGTDCSLMVKGVDDDEQLIQGYADRFTLEYSRQFGFTLENRELIVDDLRVRVVGCSESSNNDGVAPKDSSCSPPVMWVQVAYEHGGTVNTPVYDNPREGVYPGPCLIMDELSTIVVEPGWSATVNGGGDGGDVLLENHAQVDRRKQLESCSLDSIVLSIFSHRFMSIAEQMGRILQRTSVSTNIKERLDFSCAIFGDDGGLVSNAPHIPVHLGAMQEAVQYQLRVANSCECEECGGGILNVACSKLYPGDVILTNHPVAGGSHLPDLTVITPVFDQTSSSPTTPIFFVANRGHHADIGGITPGSMPPNSKSIHEEGAVFKSFKLVSRGTLMEDQLVLELNRPALYPGSSGTRNLSDNLSDLRAQVAANQKGINLLLALVGEYSLNYVQTYMRYIQENAEVAVREMLKEVKHQHGGVLVASDFMDDGSEIRLRVEIDQGNATFDFTGTTYQVLGNCNAPKAVTLSAVIYCLRCLVGRDIPLNQGCLKPVNVVVPKGCLLHPSEDAAVVGGNVLTSQRIVDVILRAFNACAASQGCMNNTTFGDDVFGYYETVAGGAGAGPCWEGRSGVHTHMTNTRITDPEVLETRYPVLLTHFSLNPNTGGVGLHRGGDGIRREIVFRKCMKLSVLSERRVFSPYGMNGGGDGAKGSNLLVLGKWRVGWGESDKVRYINLGSKTTVDVGPGDMYLLLTPGGGAWGKSERDGCGGGGNNNLV